MRIYLFMSLRFILVYIAIEVMMNIISFSPMLSSLPQQKAPQLYIAILTTLMPVSGLFILRDMLNSGIVSLTQGLMAIFIGKALFSLFFEYPRHSFPFYITFYPVKTAFLSYPLQY